MRPLRDTWRLPWLTSNDSCVTLRVDVLQLEAVSRPGEVRPQPALLRLDGTVKEQALDADVVVEPLEMADVLNRAAGMDVDGRRRMRRQRHGKGVGDRACGEEPADAEAARRVRLKDVDRPCREQAAEVGPVVAVFAGGDLDLDRGPFAHQSQTVEVVRGDRLLTDGATSGLLKGPPEHWIESLSGFAHELGFDTFVFWPDEEPLAQLERFAEEVVPPLRR